MTDELTIARLGAQGDGVAKTEAGAVYVPFALPGERVLAEVAKGRGRLTGIVQAVPERVAPICVHFGECGGCALQHLEWGRYLEWKRGRIVEALAREGIEAAVDAPVAFGPHTRRRASFTAVRAGSDTIFGFRKAQSHELIDLRQCPVLLPRFEAALPGLRDMAAALLASGEARLSVTACDNGLDVEIGAEAGQLRRISPAIAASAEAAGVIRLTAGSEPVLTFAAPRVALARVEVEPPPGAFLQASQEAEAAMAEKAVAALGKRVRHVADLFCGLGPFTFAMARRASVTAAENDRRLLAALEAGARRASGLKPIKPLARDLMREPLAPAELKGFDAVLFDPPRAGAIAQAKALAKSAVPRVIAISCDPASFARDAKALIDGGYRLESVTPFDQFVYSAHVEVLAVFGR